MATHRRQRSTATCTPCATSTLTTRCPADHQSNALLAGRSRQAIYIDWRRGRCSAEPADGGGRAKWIGAGFARGAFFEMIRAARDILLGADPPGALARGAHRALW